MYMTVYCVALLNGEIGYIVPLPEKTFKRLQDVQNEMVNRMDHVAGLNPRAFR